jgi:hypothetical protein
MSHRVRPKGGVMATCGAETRMSLRRVTDALQLIRATMPLLP